MKRLTTLTLATLALIAAGSASAADRWIYFDGVAKGTDVTTTREVFDPLYGTLLDTQTTKAGELKLDMVDANHGGQPWTSFAGYCVELGQGTSTNVELYHSGSFTGAQAQLLQGLYSSSYAFLSTNNDHAAFQVAVWEIMHETGGYADVRQWKWNAAWGYYTSNPTKGSFYIDNTAAPSVAALSNNFLAAAITYTGPARYELTKWVNGSYQDFVTAKAITPVPEPTTYAMLLGGLLGLGFLNARRRKNQG